MPPLCAHGCYSFLRHRLFSVPQQYEIGEVNPLDNNHAEHRADKRHFLRELQFLLLCAVKQLTIPPAQFIVEQYVEMVLKLILYNNRFAILKEKKKEDTV